MKSDNSPSKGAMKAARWWYDNAGAEEDEIEGLAACIDQETHLGEIIKALEEIRVIARAGYKERAALIGSDNDLDGLTHIAFACDKVLNKIKGEDTP